MFITFRKMIRVTTAKIQYGAVPDIFKITQAKVMFARPPPSGPVSVSSVLFSSPHRLTRQWIHQAQEKPPSTQHCTVVQHPCRGTPVRLATYIDGGGDGRMWMGRWVEKPDSSVIWSSEKNQDSIPASHCCWSHVHHVLMLNFVSAVQARVRGRGGVTQSIAVARADSTGTLSSDVGDLLF